MPTIEYGKKVGRRHVLCQFKWDYPVINLASGQMRMCCRTPAQNISQQEIEAQGKDVILNRPYEIERRLEQLKGITHRDCESCIRLEHAEAQSSRLGTKSWVKGYWIKHGLHNNKKLETIKAYIDDASVDLDINSQVLKTKHIGMLEVSLGNTCNLKCVYCSFHYSTQWAAEVIKYGEISEKEYREMFPAAPENLEKVFWEWFYDEARHSVETINIIGGEPTLMPDFYRFLTKLTEAFKDFKPKHRVELGVVTNLSAPPEIIKKFLAHIPEIKKHFLFRIQPSMEAMYKRAEYIRSGISWNTFENNTRAILQELKNLRLTQDEVTLGFQMALNSLSITSLPQFVQWVQDLNEEYNIQIGLMPNIVSTPKQFSPLILTPDFAPFIKETIDFIQKYESKYDEYANKQKGFGKWQSYRALHLQGLYESMSREQHPEYENDARKEFYKFIMKNDERRGADFLRTFPEYETFFNLCKSLKQ